MPGVVSRGNATFDATSLERIDRFIAEHRPPTPYVVVDLDLVRRRYQSFARCFPRATISYAVKANPAKKVVATLVELGANCDLASEGERRRCAELMVPAARLSFGNTIKRESEIARAFGQGVGLFAFDSAAELEKIARVAPGAAVYCRILAEGAGAEWPLSGKFGCAPEMAGELLQRARILGLRSSGVSFHVGSQQMEPFAWRSPIANAAKVFLSCARASVPLEFLNIGGGFPAQYRAPVSPLSAYAEAIEAALTASFGAARPRLVVEPGRALVGDAGMLRSAVLLIARKAARARRRWVYLDAGRYNGLPETFGERIRYRLRAPHEGGAAESVILAGPTCDSTDVIYQRAEYPLPLALAIGDPLDFLSAGAYTASYASVEFNGFEPIRTYCV